MKTKRNSILILGVIAISLVAYTFSSCSKKNEVTPGVSTSTPLSKEEIAQKNLKKVLSRIPKSYKVDGGVVNLTKDGFSFSTPSDGINYSSNEGVTYSQENQTMYISASSLGANAGGTVMAGSSSLDINYTFCFSASDSAMGMPNFFGNGFKGVSLVFGISGDFSALQGGKKAKSDSTNFSDFIHGVAEYVIYTDQASGSYPILNWLEDLNQEVDALTDKGFAIVIDFVNNKFYLSLDGTLNVNGGSITFTGRYLSVGAFDAFNDDDVSFEIVDGLGTMGCQ